MPDIFLSYSREDQPTARRFAEAFECAGLTVWWDQALRSGEAYDQVTEDALKQARAVVVLWSKQSVQSRWVRTEATIADRNRTFMPVMIEPCERPIMFELTHTADLSHWNGESADGAWMTFVGDVRRLVGNASPATVSAPAVAMRQGHARAIVIGVLLVLVAGALLWLYGMRSHDTVEDAVSQPSVARPVAVVTLAVLPFADMSPKHDQEYFSDGLTDELINHLGQIRDLRVTARTSSFAFKGRNEDVRTIGENLGVANLLEGSVRRDGNRLRITAQLINRIDGAQLWSQTYVPDLKDIFAIQETIAKDVAKALSIKLDLGSMSRSKGGTTDIEAYDKYLQARSFLHQFGPAEIERASALYREALVIDPDFALAWHGLYTALGYSLVTDVRRAAETRMEMKQASDRLASLAPEAWWTLATHADQFMMSRQWGEAAKAATATVARTADVDALAMYARFLMCAGRSREAVDALQQARRTDPLSLRISGLLQLYLDVAGRPDEAQTEFMRSEGLTGDHARPRYAAILRLWRSDSTATATAAVREEFLARTQDTIEHKLSGVLDQPEAALAIMRRTLASSDIDWRPLTGISFYADHYGDKDLALTALRRSFLDLDKVNFEGLWWPFRLGVRADPGFKDIVRELGLVDYWRKSGAWGDFCKPVGTDDFECR